MINNINRNQESQENKFQALKDFYKVDNKYNLFSKIERTSFLNTFKVETITNHRNVAHSKMMVYVLKEEELTKEEHQDFLYNYFIKTLSNYDEGMYGQFFHNYSYDYTYLEHKGETYDYNEDLEENLEMVRNNINNEEERNKVIQELKRLNHINNIIDNKEVSMDYSLLIKDEIEKNGIGIEKAYQRFIDGIYQHHDNCIDIITKEGIEYIMISLDIEHTSYSSHNEKAYRINF